LVLTLQTGWLLTNTLIRTCSRLPTGSDREPDVADGSRNRQRNRREALWRCVQNIRAAFRRLHHSHGEVGTGTQTSYVVALYTKMAPKLLSPCSSRNLSRTSKSATAFVDRFLERPSCFHACRSRTLRCRLSPVAERYLSSWLHAFKGRNHLWERGTEHWRSRMNSYNHYAFGSVIAWVYRYAAGSTQCPTRRIQGDRHSSHLDARMTSARAEYDSIYGKITSDWTGTPAGPFL